MRFPFVIPAVPVAALVFWGCRGFPFLGRRCRAAVQHRLLVASVRVSRGIGARKATTKRVNPQEGSLAFLPVGSRPMMFMLR
jgi:hypothetical protein